MCMHMLTLNWLAVCMLEQTGTYTFYIHRIRIGKDKDTTCMYLHMSTYQHPMTNTVHV